MESPTFVDDLPSPPPGMVFIVSPPEQVYYQDPFWYDTAGRDTIDQRHIFSRYSGEEQKEKLKEVLQEFPRKGGAIISKAVKKGQAHVIATLFELGVEIEKENGLIKGKQMIPPVGTDLEEIGDVEDEDPDEETDYYPLHFACFLKQFECVKVLIERGGVDVNAADDHVSTPLSEAAHVGDLEIVKWLFDHEADPTLKRDGRIAAFTSAAFSGNVEVIRLIEDNPKSINAGIAVDLSYLGNGCASGNIEMVRFILERSGLLLGDGTIPKERVLGVDEISEFEESLPTAIGAKSLASIELLLSYLTSRNAEGEFKPYKISQPDVTNEIFGATEDAISDAAIFQLVWEVLVKPSVDDLVSGMGKLGVYDAINRQMLSACGPDGAPDGAIDTLRVIMEKYHADANYVSRKYKVTSLTQAASQGYVEIVRMLVEEFGADIHLGSGEYANGPTALHRATQNGLVEVVKLLLMLGGPIEKLDLGDGVGENGKVVVCAMDGARAPVLVFSEEKFEEEEESLNCVRWFSVQMRTRRALEKLIEGLKFRKSDELLEEVGERARPLEI